jgi:anti-anti-sigma regulatory factor
LLCSSGVTARIEAIKGAEGTTIRLIGQLDAEYLSELKDQIEANGRVVVLQMDEVKLVDVDVVRFLIECELQGIELLGCSAYIREWIARERNRAN